MRRVKKPSLTRMNNFRHSWIDFEPPCNG